MKELNRNSKVGSAWQVHSSESAAQPFAAWLVDGAVRLGVSACTLQSGGVDSRVGSSVLVRRRRCPSVDRRLVSAQHRAAAEHCTSGPARAARGSQCGRHGWVDDTGRTRGTATSQRPPRHAAWRAGSRRRGTVSPVMA